MKRAAAHCPPGVLMGATGHAPRTRRQRRCGRRARRCAFAKAVAVIPGNDERHHRGFRPNQKPAQRHDERQPRPRNQAIFPNGISHRRLTGGLGPSASFGDTRENPINGGVRRPTGKPVYRLGLLYQDLQRILRCHIAALEVIGGKPGEISVRSLENRGPRRGYGPSRGL
jgi:hypothetical protein